MQFNVMIENLVILVGYGYVGALIPSSVFWKSGITRNEMNGYGTMDGKCGIFGLVQSWVTVVVYFSNGD